MASEASSSSTACWLRRFFPSDLSPDAPTLVAPSEVHPIYNVTGVSWLKRNRPEIKTAAMCAQSDLLGLPSIATYRAAFEVAGIELVAERLFEPSTTDFGSIVEYLMSAKPDLLCWDTAYEPFVHALTIEAFRRGFEGSFLSCTCDNYPELIERTSAAFMEGFVFQFPDFDDPRLEESRVNFGDPGAFYAEFCRRFPGSWSAVSWEYASTLELWKSAVQRARSFEPFTVLATMKLGGVGHHAFGEAKWWGKICSASITPLSAIGRSSPSSMARRAFKNFVRSPTGGRKTAPPLLNTCARST